MKLYYIRHGQSQANADGVLAGQADSPLTEYGVQQAIQEGGQLHKEGEQFDVIISSPLARAYDTAVAIAQAIGYELDAISIDDRLMERSVGELEGKSTDLLSSAIRDSAMGVETNVDFAARCQEFIDDTMTTYVDKKVLIVAHAGVGEMVQLLVRDKDIATFVTDGLSIPNAQLFRLM